MKRWIGLLLVTMLLLSGCDEALMASADGISAGNPQLSSSQDENGLSTAPSGENSAAQVPEAMPMETGAALALPQTLAASDTGHGVTLLSPAQYDAYLEQGRGGYRGFLQTDHFMIRNETGKYAYVNENGKIITDFIYDDISVYWDNYEGVIVASIDGKQGALNPADGSQMIAFQYDMVWPVPGTQLIEARTQDVSEILDRSGKTRFMTERGDQIHRIGQNLLLLQGNMVRIYNLLDYSPVKNFACEQIDVAKWCDDEPGIPELVSVKTNGRWGVIDENGDFIVQPLYEEIGHAPQGGYHFRYKQDGKWGVMDDRGNVVIKPQWDDMIVYKNSVSVCKDGKWGAYAPIEADEPTILVMYDFVGAFGEYYASYEHKGKYGLLDKDGNTQIPATYEYPVAEYGTNLEKGYFSMEGSGPLESGILGTGKQIVLPRDHYVKYGNEDEPYNLICTPRGKWGYVDTKGQFVIDAQFDNADLFIEERDVAFVQQEGTVRLIDRSGKVVLNTVFSDVIAYNPKTMVCLMEYKDAAGTAKVCIAKLDF